MSEKRVFVIIGDNNEKEIINTLHDIYKIFNEKCWIINILFLLDSIKIIEKDEVQSILNKMGAKVNIYVTRDLQNSCNIPIKTINYEEYLKMIKKDDIVIKQGFTCPYAVRSQ